MLKQLIHAALTFIGLSIPNMAHAQMDPIIPTDVWAMRSQDEEGIYNVLGFPVNYDFTADCAKFTNNATFKKIFLAKNMDIKLREEFEKVIAQLGDMQIVTEGRDADLLLNAGLLNPGSGSDNTVFNLWAVSKRATKTTRGVRCKIAEGLRQGYPSTAAYFKSYLAAMASTEGGPFHFAGRHRYAMQGSCYKLIPDAEILSFKNIYVSATPSPKITDAIKQKLAATGKYVIVDKTAKADYIVSINRDVQTYTTRTVSRGMSGTQTDGNGDPNNPQNTTSSWSTPDTVDISTSSTEFGELLVLAIKHPQYDTKPGIICAAYKQAAKKNAAFNIWNPKGTSGTLVNGLMKYLENPDLSFKSID